MNDASSHDLAEPEAGPVLAITIGANGRIYCHDIDADLLPVLESICPGDPSLVERRAAARAAGAEVPAEVPSEVPRS
jgi:hypothetical protein